MRGSRDLLGASEVCMCGRGRGGGGARACERLHLVLFSLLNVTFVCSRLSLVC